MLQFDAHPLRVRFLSRSLPAVQTDDGEYVVEPAIYRNAQGVRHCIVAHRRKADARGRFDVIELSPNFESYPLLLAGFLHGFDVQPEDPVDRVRAARILRRLLELRAAEIVTASISEAR